MSCDTDHETLLVKERSGYAVVLTTSKASSHTSCVFCLKLHGDNEQNHVKGNPFKLLPESGEIWRNIDLRKAGIQEGSIVVVDQSGNFVNNTKEKMEISTVLAQLQFASGNHGVVYRGVADAFPDEKIQSLLLGKQRYRICRPPDPTYALISVKSAVAFDGRIVVTTRLREKLNLRNRSRAYNPSDINKFQLPVQEPTSEDDVGSVIIVSFGKQSVTGELYRPICAGILLGSEPIELSCYPMARNPRGICLIINNLVFDDGDTQSRHGGEKDEEVLHQLFHEELGFVVEVFNDQQHFEMLQKAEEFAKLDHSNYDSFICIIMSHGGEKDTIKGVKGRKIYIEDITSEFKPSNCPTLAGKPKVFIVQACRGPSEDQNLQPIHLTAADGDKSGLVKDSTLPRSVTPEESDFLYAFSTVPGYVSWRVPGTGSPFIQTLVEVIKEYRGKEHFSDMLTIVNRRLTQREIQVSAPTTSLRYKLFL